MGSRHAGTDSARRARIAVERLEGRDLPTAPSLLASPVSALGIRSLAATAQGSTAADVARVPTPREAARQRFVAKFSGPFVVGPGRFTDQASQIYLQAGGTSNVALHVDLQLGAFTPADSSGVTSGTAALIMKNVTNTGDLLVLELVGDPASLDRRGRPTRFTWTVSGASGGVFSDAVGEGTLELRYWPGNTGSLHTRASNQGQAGAIFQGRVETNSVLNILRS